MNNKQSNYTWSCHIHPTTKGDWGAIKFNPACSRHRNRIQVSEICFQEVKMYQHFQSICQDGSYPESGVTSGSEDDCCCYSWTLPILITRKRHCNMQVVARIPVSAGWILNNCLVLFMRCIRPKCLLCTYICALFSSIIQFHSKFCCLLFSYGQLCTWGTLPEDIGQQYKISFEISQWTL